jgi:hypothetical protein
MTVNGPSRQTDKKPLWTADIDIVSIDNNWPFRGLFVGQGGTMIVRCTINEVDIYFDAVHGQKFDLRPNDPDDAGMVAVLVLQMAPEAWTLGVDGKMHFDHCTCVAGEIVLPATPVVGGAKDWRRHFNPIADGVDGLTVHSSGLSFKGKTRFPWETAARANQAHFHAMLPFQSDNAPLLVELDRDRLSTDAANEMIASFAKLDDALHPLFSRVPPRSEAVRSGPVWAQLTLTNRSAVPQFHWNLTAASNANGATANFVLGQGELSLQLMDGVTGAAGNSVDMATANPVAAFSVDSTGNLTLTLNDYKSTDTPDGQYSYFLKTAAESFAFTSVKTAYDPLSTAATLRQQYSLPHPETSLTPNPPLLWGFVPAADGWVQLPFLNVSESIYADAFPQTGKPGAPAQSLITGAVSFGNVLATRHGEQPWSVTLLDAGRLTGQWKFDASLTIQEAVLEFFSPDVELNGFLWLGTDPPTAADALPALGNWLRAVRMVPLRTRHAGGPTPSAVLANFTNVSFSRQTGADNPPPLLAGFAFEVIANSDPAPAPDSTIYDKLVNKYFPGVYVKDKTWQDVPFYWRRHLTLPTIQALPFTQTQDPPNYPSPSRQFAPFALDIDATGRPSNWTFAATGTNAAQNWPTFTGHATPSSPLAMASISLPGLSFEPNAADGPIASTYMGAQYRFGLPYLNEIDALSQLSKPDTSTDPHVRPAPLPLTRDRYADYWNQLKLKADMAAAQGDAALSLTPGGHLVVTGLAEPFPWPITSALTATYPGKLVLQDVNGGPPLTLEKDDALGGFAGGFNLLDAANLKFVAGAPGATFQLTGGSLAAQGAGGTVRDQRGLIRGATVLTASGNLETPLTAPGKAWRLRTALASMPLTPLAADAKTKWDFWFRDLPADLANNTFDRNVTRSKAARGVNDPAALSPEFVHLTGYEWRMGHGEDAGLPLLGFSFYPLTLEQVAFAGDASVSAVVVVGRLLLPWADPKQEADRANAVRLTFTAQSTGLTLFSIKAEDIDPDRGDPPDNKPIAPPDFSGHKGEWPLAVSPDDAAVMLFWDTVSLDKNGAIALSDATLDFLFWGKRWVAPITFTGTQGVAQISPNATDPVCMTQATLVLDPLNKDNLSLSLRLVYRWGDPQTVFLEADETCVILGKLKSSTITVSLKNSAGGQLALNGGGSSLEGSVQLKWDAKGVAVGGWQLLPGMSLDPHKPMSGFAAMTFVVNGFPVQPPLTPISMQSGFAESMIPCEWGESLQEPGTVSRAQVFGSSAGTISAGLAWNGSGGKWTSSLLLNGLLEVKNLISWPHPDTALSSRRKDGAFQFTIPGIRQNPLPKLDHARHTIRVLFNQHTVPQDALAAGGDRELFSFADNSGWQTLAIVEHQLVNVQVNADAAVRPTGLTWDRRWTALQEVRFLSPGAFAAFLDQLKKQNTTQATGNGIEQSTLSNASVFYGDKLLDLLTAKASPIPQMTGSLLVEASTMHWVRQNPSPVTFTPLQYLPGSTPSGARSVPADFGASIDPQTREWLLLPMPFLGRLQPSSLDWTEASQPFPEAGPLLRVDPVNYLAKERSNNPPALPQIPLLLASWADKKDVSLSVGQFDAAQMRTFERLDPASLEESWYRLQTPPREDPLRGLTTVLATPPVDGPGRLGRPASLARVFEAYRFSLPPSPPGSGVPATVDSSLPVAWRRDQTFLLQGFQQSVSDYVLYLAGAIFFRAPFPVPGNATVTYYPSATMIPPVLTAGGMPNPQPVSLAVSPYLGLKRRIPTLDNPPPPPQLVYADLLCSQPSGALGTLATQLWLDAQAQDPANYQAWARDTLNLLAPDSRVAVLRLRELRSARLEDGSKTATVVYDFVALPLTVLPELARNAHPVRTQLQRLRYAEGQFGGSRKCATFNPSGSSIVRKAMTGHGA